MNADDSVSTEPPSVEPSLNDPKSWVVSRRQFMGAAAATSLMGVVVPYDPKVHLASQIDHRFAELTPQSLVVVQPAQPVLTMHVERDTDLFLADFTFCGFSLSHSGGKLSLVATATKTTDNWIGIIVQLPPQAIAEGDYWEVAAGKLPFDPSPVLSQVSGPTRLAFTFAHGTTIPLPTKTAADLLDWSGWTLNVSPPSLSGTGYSTAVRPTALQTAIECPIDTFLSPVTYNNAASKIDVYTKFENRTTPLVSPRAIVECWSTSLAMTVVSHIEEIPTAVGEVPAVAVIWANDYPSSSGSETAEEYIDYFLAPTS
jgi:hypothetical protein